MHAVHAQCLVDFRDRTRNVQALFMCPQCRCPLEEGGNRIIDSLNLRPSATTDEMPPPPSLESGRLRRQESYRATPGSPGSPLPRADALCCPMLLHHETAERRLMELQWAPDFDSQGNILRLAWMCEVCNEPLLWDELVAASTFEVSNEFLEQIGNCATHPNVAPIYRAQRSESRLSVEIHFRCGCRPNLVWTEEEIQSFLADLDEAMPRDRSGRRHVRRVGHRAPPPPAPSGAAEVDQATQVQSRSREQVQFLTREQLRARRQLSAQDAAPPSLQPELADRMPPVVIPADRYGNSTFSPIFIALLLDSAGLLTQPAHDA